MSLTETLKISLIDDVSKPARTVAQALKEAEAAAKRVAEGMKGSGATDRFVKRLSGLKLAQKDIETVAKAWKEYADAARAAGRSDDWIRNSAETKAWESRTIASLKAVEREERNYAKAASASAKAAAAKAATVSPMTAAMSQSAMANSKMIAGMSVYGARRAGGAAEGAARGRFARLREGASDFAMFAAPGTAGMAMGMGGAAAGGLAAGAGATYSLKQAISFEKAMAEVKKKVNLDQGATWGDVEGMINRNARAFGIAREDMASLAAQAGQAGIAYQDLSEFMQLASKTSVAWDVSAREASERLSKIKAATQWTIPQLSEFADKVNMLGDTSASAERDIAEMFSRSAAAAKAANVPLDTTLAVTTALNSTGMQEEVASRFWNAFSAKVRTAGQASKETAAAYKQLGMSVQEVDKGMKSDATGTILKVLQALEKSPDKAAIGVKLFGEQWWDEAARAGQTLPEIQRLLKQVQNPETYKGSLDKTLAVQLETTANHLERIKNVAGEIAGEFGKWALPTINSTIDSIASKFEKIQNMNKLVAEGDEIIKKKGENLTEREKTRLEKDPVLQKRLRQVTGGTGESIADFEKRIGIQEKPKAPPKPIFEQMGADAFRLPRKKEKSPPFAQEPGAAPLGVQGQMAREKFPTFAVRPEGLTFRDKTIVPQAPAPATLPPKKVEQPVEIVPAVKKTAPLKEPTATKESLPAKKIEQPVEVVQALKKEVPLKEPTATKESLPTKQVEQPVEILKKVVSESPIVVPATKETLPQKTIEQPARVLQQMAPAAPVAPAVKPPPPPPTPASVIRPSAPVPVAAPAVPSLAPQELKVTPNVAPVPQLPAQDIQINPVVGPLPAFATQELQVTPNVAPVPPIPPQEMQVLPTFASMPALPPQEMQVIPTFGALPPLPAQEMTVVPKIDMGGFSAFSSAVTGATASFQTLNQTVTPHVDSSSIDAVSGKASTAHGAVSSLNMTATPTVNTGSIDAAIAKANQLRSILSGISAQASAAGAAAAGAAAQATRAAAAIGSAAKVSRANYVAPSVEGRT